MQSIMFLNFPVVVLQPRPGRHYKTKSIKVWIFSLSMFSLALFSMPAGENKLCEVWSLWYGHSVDW